MTERRPWRRAIAWVAFLGPFFFASYGFANWLASRMVGVGAVVFPWERAIPFLPWTIVPYWSTDLLYVLSLLICATRRELDRHAQRLLMVQVVSIVCFIAFPLRFSFDRPAVGGVFGALFAVLGSFDKPYNQAPSLHIGLLVVVWTRLAAHCPPRWRWALGIWMVATGVSILTTYQHHFVDLPTGLAVGLAALWALPSGLFVVKDPNDGSRRILASFKHNTYPMEPPALAFRFVSEQSSGRVQWEGTTDWTAEALFASSMESETTRAARRDAREFLQDSLDLGPLPTNQVIDAGKAHGIAARTLERARRDLGVISERRGGRKGTWYLKLVGPTRAGETNKEGSGDTEEPISVGHAPTTAMLQEFGVAEVKDRQNQIGGLYGLSLPSDVPSGPPPPA